MSANFSESHDWLQREEAKKRKQLYQLEESFYSSRGRVGITGFFMDCLAGKQEDETLFDLESANKPQPQPQTEAKTFMEEPITFALVSSTQMIMTAVDSITTGISNLFSWTKKDSQNIPNNTTNQATSTSDLFEIVIESEMQKTMQKIQKSYETVPVVEDKRIESIESPKMTNISWSATETLSSEQKCHKRSTESIKNNVDIIDDSEYVDSGNYWYQRTDYDDEDDDFEEEDFCQSASFFAIESYIDFSQDSKIVAKPIPKRRTASSSSKNIKAKVHFEPMVELMDNVVNNDKAAIKKALQEGNVKVNDYDKLGYTMLHYAASHNHVDLIKFLIEKGADVNSLDFTNWTPLHLAAIADNYKACKILLDLGANFESPNNDDHLPIDLTEDSKIKKLLSDATKKKLASKKVRAIYDYVSDSPEYLSLKKSETFKVLDRRQEWWLVQNEEKQIGLVPRTFVQ